jgi:CheY-like chemotaxis protein
MSEHRETILVVDDDELFREQLRRALEGIGCRVHAFPNLTEAASDIKTGFSPSVIFADRWIQQEPIEKHLLGEIRQTSPDSLVVIYTRIDELTRSEERRILSMGAIRVLDTTEVAGSADSLLDEFKELRELSNALSDLTTGRSSLLTALVGTDVALTVIDRQHICWFANARHQELFCNAYKGGLGRCLFHDQPPGSGACAGCGIDDVLATGAPVQRTILTHIRGDSVRWLSVHCKPIRDSSGKRVIAATKAVSELDPTYIETLEPLERLFAVARGLLHAGFGRVSIYREHAEKEAHRLVAAASRQEGFEDNSYFNGLRDLDVDYTSCPYSVRACESEAGLLVKEWDVGPSPFKDTLGLELPHVLVPIRDDRSGDLLGLLAADFVGWGQTRAKATEKSPREVAEEHLARPETLKWVRDGYCREAGKALLTIHAGESPRSAEAFARQRAALRARQRIGAAGALDEAIAVLREGLMEIGPDCEFFVRRKRGNRLITEVSLDVPTDLNRRDVTDLDDDRSLSAYTLSTYRRPLWIDDYHDWCREEPSLRRPRGSCEPKIRSVARVPLRIEGTDYGVLCVECPNSRKWREEGFVEPLTSLAEHAALLLRDLAIRDDLEAARKRSEDARVAQDFARGMSYSLHTRVGLLEMDLALLKWELGERHSEAVRKMADSIEFFKHASVLVTRGLEFEELGVRASANLNLNDVVRRVVDRHRKGSFICQVAESNARRGHRPRVGSQCR